MNPVSPEEISALLDGELGPGRAEEVRRAIAADQSLQRLFQQHYAFDVDLRAYSQELMFRPQVSVSNYSLLVIRRVFNTALILLMVRFVVKVIPSGFGIGLEIMALALVVGWVLLALIRISEEERVHLVQAVATND